MAGGLKQNGSVGSLVRQVRRTVVPLCRRSPTKKREGRHNREGGLLGTRGKLVGWNDGRASVSNQGPKEEIDFFANECDQATQV